MSEGAAFPKLDVGWWMVNVERCAPAFNLVELMFSILILGIGLVSIASLFPLASSLQQQTMDQVLAYQAAKNAEFALTTRYVDPGYLPPAGDAKRDGRVIQLNGIGADPYGWGTNFDADVWPVLDRSYPGNEPFNRRMYWVPLFRWDQGIGDWEVYVFVIKAVDNMVVPPDGYVVIDDTLPAYSGDYVIYPGTDGDLDQENTQRQQQGLRPISRFERRLTDTNPTSPENPAEPYDAAEGRWRVAPVGNTSIVKHAFTIPATQGVVQ
jgi:type II secretory pathway pseudopilin PulG